MFNHALISIKLTINQKINFELNNRGKLYKTYLYTYNIYKYIHKKFILYIGLSIFLYE